MLLNSFDSIFDCMNLLVLVWDMLLDSFLYLEYLKLDHCYLLPISLPELFVSSHEGTMTMSLMTICDGVIGPRRSLLERMDASYIWDNEDVHNLGSAETQFPARVFNDTLTSEAALSCEPTVSSLNNDEIDFRISFDESDDEDCTPTVSYFDDLDYFKDFDKEFPAIVYNDALMSKLDFLTEPTVCRDTVSKPHLVIRRELTFWIIIQSLFFSSVSTWYTLRRNYRRIQSSLRATYPGEWIWRPREGKSTMLVENLLSGNFEVLES
ncbi:hypothetical protein Tco_1518121 [Tanacetum coccineum]